MTLSVRLGVCLYSLYLRVCVGECVSFYVCELVNILCVLSQYVDILLSITGYTCLSM